MNLSLVVVVLLGLAAQVSQVSAVACTTDADCKATDLTLALCEATVCKCKAGYVATEEGCAEKNPTPTVTTPGGNNQVISGSSAKLTCSGGLPSDTIFTWYDSSGTEIPGETSDTYTTPALSVDTEFSCKIKCTREDLSSDESDPATSDVLDNGDTSDATPVITLSSPKVANGKTFTATCSGAPAGATVDLQADGIAVTPGTGPITQVADPTGKELTCAFTATGVTFTQTATLAYPTLATVVESATITSSPSITADIVYRTSDTLPTLTCETTPGVEYLPTSPAITYAWTGPATVVTTETWTIPSTDNQVYNDIKCTAGTVESAVFHKITVDDDFLAVPTIAQTPSSPVAGGQVALTCTVAAGVTGVVYSWTKDSVGIAGQVDKTIQYTGLTSGSNDYTCTATKESFSQTSTPLTVTVASTLAKPTISGEAEVGKWGHLCLACVSSSEAGAMTYTWTKAGSAIDAATSKTYSVHAVDEKNEGTYACTTSFAALTATSDDFNVDVVAAGVNCITDGECDVTDASLIGTCDTTSSRCMCAENFYAAGSECANGVSQVAGSLLVIFAAALISRLF